RARELVLELGDATLVVRLLFLGGVVLRVLGKIAVGARIGDLLDDARTLHRLTVLELALQRRIALGRHRDLVHRSLPPARGAMSPSRSAGARPGYSTQRAAASRGRQPVRTGNGEKSSDRGPLAGSATAELPRYSCRPGLPDLNRQARPK